MLGKKSLWHHIDSRVDRLMPGCREEEPACGPDPRSRGNKESLTNNMQKVQILTMDATYISVETCIHVVWAHPWLGCTVPWTKAWIVCVCM